MKQNTKLRFAAVNKK